MGNTALSSAASCQLLEHGITQHTNPQFRPLQQRLVQQDLKGDLGSGPDPDTRFLTPQPQTAADAEQSQRIWDRTL